MKNGRTTHIDPRIYLLLSVSTLGLGAAFLIFYFVTSNEIAKLLFLIGTSALLPAGILWTVEHYFLQVPIQSQYESIVDQYRHDQDLMETIQCSEKYHFRAVSDERAPLIRRVLDTALDDETCREIIIIGSTLNGLFRQGVWFEDFVRCARAKKKHLKLMFTHWDYVTHREKWEDRADGAIADELRQSLVRVLTWGVPAESIRLVRGAPTVFMIIAGNNMLLNPYPIGRESVTSLTLWLLNPDPSKPEGPPGSIWHAYYINHYEKAWNPEKYPREINTVQEVLSSPLPPDWEKQIDIFIGGVIRERLKRAGLSDTSS